MGDNATVAHSAGSRGNEHDPADPAASPDPLRSDILTAEELNSLVDVLEELPLPEDRDVARHLVQRLTAWSAPLPDPEQLAAYETEAPGAANLILQDFTERSGVAIRAANHEMDLQSREMLLREREQALRQEESQHDRAEARRVVNSGGSLLFLLIFLVFAFIMWGPQRNDWVVFAIAALFFIPFLCIGLVFIFRGRMTDQHREVYVEAMPKILAAVATIIRSNPSSHRATDTENDQGTSTLRHPG